MAKPGQTPGAGGPALLRLSVLGPVAVSFAGREVKIKSRKTRAFLAYLALSDGLEETRERLIGLLWSESDEEKARASLRQSVHELKELLGEAGYEGLRAEKLAIGLDRAGLDLDLWAVLREAEAQRAHPLLLDQPRLPERLLEGFDDLDPAFRVWLLAKRQTLHDRFLRGLEAGLRSTQNEPARRAELAQALINLDPTHEEACRYLMRARAEAGDIGGALRVYKALWDVLGDEYDMEPSLPTQQLVAEIKSRGIERVPVAAAPRAPEVRLKPATRIELAINSFALNGIDGTRSHMVPGFRQQLIASLVRFREWYVTDRSAQLSPSATPPPVSARYLVEGTAYPAADAITLVLTLKELGTNLYVWSYNFALSLENWFEQQQNVVRRIAMALNVHLSAERLARLAAEPDVSLDIYDRWLRGQALILGFSASERERKVAIFRAIIGEAPEFSPAYSSLVQTINLEHIFYPGVFRSREKEQQALELARKAVQLDPVDSRAHLCLAWSHAMAKQYEQAEFHANLASQLNENDPWTLISASHVYGFCGAHEPARRLMVQARDLSPSPSRAQWGYEAGICFLAGDYQGCVAAVERAGEIILNLGGWNAAALYHLGRRAEAERESERFLRLIRSKWSGADEPTEETISRWFLHLFPIRHQEDWRRLRDGLAGAAVRIGDIDHHQW